MKLRREHRLPPILLLIALTSLTIVPSILVTRVSASPPDFSISASPGSLTLSQGASSWLTLTLSGTGSYQGNVSLSTAETFDYLDIGTQLKPLFALISPSTPSANSNLSISVSTWTLPGSYSITIVGFDGAVQRSTQINLQVTGQDFTISASAARLTFPLGVNKTLNTQIKVSSLGGFSGNVNLTISVGSSFPYVRQLPFASPTSQKVSITPSAPASFQLAITINSSMIAAPYSATIQGVGATTTGNARGFDLTIVIGPDFNMSLANNNLVVHQGEIAVTSVTYTSLNGFVGVIAAYAGRITSNPPEPDIPMFPATALLRAGGTNSSRIVARADDRTGLGTYLVWIEAADESGSWLAGSLPLNVTVEGPSTTPPDFAIYTDPAQMTTTIGSTVTSTINLLGLNGFTGSVDLFADYGPGASLSPGSVLVSPSRNSTSTLTINVPGPDGLGGGYTPWWYVSGGDAIVVIATDSAGFAQLVWVNATATPFSVSANPTQQQAKPGSTLAVAITVNGVGGFNDTVTLSANPSSSVGASLSKSVLNFTGSPGSLDSSLTISIPAGTPDGNYVVQVTGTYMRPAYVCSCAPKYPLRYTVPVHVIVSATPAEGTILGLSPTLFYGIVGAIAAGAVILTGYALARRKSVAIPPTDPAVH